LDDLPQPSLAIRCGEESNLVSLGVAVEGRRPLSVKVTQTDIHSKSPRSAQVTALGLTALGTDDLDHLVTDRLETITTPAEATSQLLLLGPPTSEPTELEVLAQAARDEAGWFMTAEGEINCDAYGSVLQPRRTVLVQGAGDFYSGAYYVTRVTHTLSADGDYRQRFEAKRNAQGLRNTDQFDGGSPGVPLPGV
jgi:phage protein D